MSNGEDNPEVEQESRGGAHYDNPNQQVVRPDGSGPGMPEGEGGSGSGPTAQPFEEQRTEETPPARKRGRPAGRRDDDT